MDTPRNYDKILLPLCYFAWCSLALFLFVSVSLVNLFHILIIIPGFYYTYFLIKEKRSRIPKSIWGLFIFLFLAILSVFINWNDMEGGQAIQRMRYFLIGILAIAPTHRLMNSSYFTWKKKKALFIFFFASTLLASLYGLAIMITDTDILNLFDSGFNVRVCGQYKVRNCGFYGGSGPFGHNMQQISLLSLGVLLYYKKIPQFLSRKWILFHAVISILGLYFSYSRGALLGFLIGAPLIFWATNKRYIWRLYGLSFVLLGMIGMAIYWGLDNKILGHYTLKFKAHSNMARIALYQTALYTFKENPVWGLGFRNFKPHSLRLQKKYGIDSILIKREQNHDVHNNYLEILVGCGLFGFLAFLCFYFFWLTEILRSTKLLTALFFPPYIASFIGGMTSSNFADAETAFVIMGVYSLFQVLNRNRNYFKQ